MTAAETPRKARRTYRKHGASALATALKRGSVADLDGRLAQVRDARLWAQEYAADRGGEDTLGVGYQTLLEAAKPVRLMARHIEGVLLAKPEWILNRRRRCLSNLAKDYLSVLKALRETLIALGLDRVPKPLPSLADRLRAIEERRAAEDAARGAQAQPVAVEAQAVPVAQDAAEGQGGGRGRGEEEGT